MLCRTGRRYDLHREHHGLRHNSIYSIADGAEFPPRYHHHPQFPGHTRTKAHITVLVG